MKLLIESFFIFQLSQNMFIFLNSLHELCLIYHFQFFFITNIIFLTFEFSVRFIQFFLLFNKQLTSSSDQLFFVTSSAPSLCKASAFVAKLVLDKNSILLAITFIVLSSRFFLYFFFGHSGMKILNVIYRFSSF